MPWELQPGCDLVRQEEALANTPLQVLVPGWKTFNRKHSFAKICFWAFPAQENWIKWFQLVWESWNSWFRHSEGRGRKNKFPGVNPSGIFQTLSHPAGSVCVWSHPECRGACGTTVAVVLPCHLSSWPRAATQMDVEGAVVTEYPKGCEPRGKVAQSDLFSLSIPTVF